MDAASSLGATGLVRDAERDLVLTAGAVFAVASAGAGMSAAAADALFLSELGPGHFGEAMAGSSALLAIVLGVVGGLADRLDRRRVLAVLAASSALVLLVLAGLAAASPVATAVVALIVGKQLAASCELAFWVAIAERVDARRSRRVLPLLAAAGGAGAALGGVFVIVLAPVVGAPGVLLAAAGLFGLAAAGAMRLAPTRRMAASVAPVGTIIVRAWRDGARAIRRHPLATHLALVVALAGAFSMLAYFALGVALAAEGSSTAELTAVIGGLRGAGQVITLVVQLAIAPWLLARLGTATTLLLAPLVAVAAGLGLVIAPILAVAIAAQMSTRVLDAGVQSPAEKLAQTLLPVAVRGRVAGFLDGPAKRAGAVVGGLVAAVLVAAPLAFVLVLALTALVWLAAAARIARALPTLAIEHVARDADAEPVVDGRAISALRRELEGPRPERAAELFVRLHERGRIDAVPVLAHACCEPRAGSRSDALWRSLVAVLDAPAEGHGPALLAAARCHAGDLALAIRAIGLAGGIAPAALDPWRDGEHALVVEIARLRLGRDHDGVLGVLADATRAGGDAGDVATEELVVEVARALATDLPDHILAATRHLIRALRRSRGTVAARTAGCVVLGRVIAWGRARRTGTAAPEHLGAELALVVSDLLELVRDRSDAAAAPVAPDHVLTSIQRLPARGRVDDAPEIAAALRLYGRLLEGAEAIEPDDLRRIARALGEPDDAVRAAAEAALAALELAAAGVLIETAAWGRRRARDRAAALLAALPVTPASLERLIDAELDALDRTHAALAVLTEPGDELLARRLAERVREIAHTVLLLVAAHRRSPAIARAAAAWAHARGALERARTLAVIETALPRALVERLIDAADDASPVDRARSLARSQIQLPGRDAVMRAELAGRDRVARALALHGLGAAGRSAHRDTISSAALAEVRQATAADLARKVTGAVRHRASDGGADMPSRVESLIALGRVPLLASLTTRQLADVAERSRWLPMREGGVIVAAGDLIDALIVVDEGELVLGERRIGKGEVVDELACVAPVAAAGDLRAITDARLIRLERLDFEELVDDVPGLAAAVCRALGERARRAEQRGYRSPLASRS
jgi:hypothetical protein